MMNTYRSFGTQSTPQREPIPGAGQVENSAGGYTWQITPWQQLERFLILGTQGGTYYIGERELTKQNAENIWECLKLDYKRTIDMIVSISTGRRALRNDPAVFALAVCAAYMPSSDDPTRGYAFEQLSKVCRIGTHLFHFVEFYKQFRPGIGRGWRKAISKWYENQSASHLAVDLVKYRQRDGWSHADLVKLSHVGYEYKAEGSLNGPLYDWVLKGVPGHETPETPNLTIINGYEKAQNPDLKPEAVAELIKEYNLPREAILPEHLKNAVVYEALVGTMYPEALVRNIVNMAAVDLLKPFSPTIEKLTERLSNVEQIRKSGLHPLRVLSALMIYSKGRNRHNSWEPVPQVVDLLNKLFYECFPNVEPSGKNTLLALDVSGSMTNNATAGMDYMSCAQGAAAMAMVTARIEPNYHILGFDSGMKPLNITANTSLQDAFANGNLNNGDATDCALPMAWAINNKVPVDTFVIYTDAESWAGKQHTVQRLRDYRREMDRPEAKLICVGMTSNKFTIADPRDAGMADVVGFDTDTPQVVAEFSR